jgi:AraC family transcriptional regulator of adaptative response/methylated-DNA-[protein]-cysteine methyltransferase
MALRLCHLIESQTDSAPSLNILGSKLGVSPYHLHRTFKRLTGITPHQYAAAHRLRQFKSRIKAGVDISSALYGAGYSSSSRLYEKALKQLGMTPAIYQRGGKGMRISYTIIDCRLGHLLLAVTEHGVCAVQFGANDSELAAALNAEYPAASIHYDPKYFVNWTASLLYYVDEELSRLNLPLDLQSTIFQLRVWEGLCRIPYGDTRSFCRDC